MRITIEDIRNNEAISTYIRKADESLIAMGFTEHSFAHVGKVAHDAKEILETLGYPQRQAELAEIAGYLHDIGNVINRIDHAQSGAVMAFRILDKMGADAEDIATIVTAIGNHDEKTAYPVNPVAAALILADKCDVRDTRVRNKDHITFDIHDRVNYSVKQSKILIRLEEKEIELRLRIDTTICAVMDYFEIFLTRMILCKKAAEKLELKFVLRINGQKLM
ncbi:MAG: HD domain-containing protein [Firmicutes bacterium]|nr:HD domain-containing protein [Bacillota bacterium]